MVGLDAGSSPGSVVSMVTAQQVQDWLDAYVEAWRTYDADLIGDLFAEDATYAYTPWDDPTRGREAIVAEWLADQDAPGSWEAEYHPLMIGETGVVARGQTRYASGKVYENLWILEFDDAARCTKYVDWYMERPKDES